VETQKNQTMLETSTPHDDPIASGLFVLPDHDIYASDRRSFQTTSSSPKPHSSRHTRFNSEPINFARPFPLRLEEINLNTSDSIEYHPVYGALTARRSSRKSPPKITESLEDLARSVSIDGGSTSSGEENFETPVETPSKIQSKSLFVLPVDPPSMEVISPPPLPAKSSMRPLAPPIQTMSTDTLAKSRLYDTSSPWPTRNGNVSTPITPTRRISPSSSSSNSPQTPLTSASSAYLARLNTHRPSQSSASTNPLTCTSGSASSCGTWSLAEEVDFTDKAYASPSKRGRESRKAKKMRKIAEEEKFDIDTPPSVRELFEASLLEVIGEDGKKVKFGDLLKGKKTIVVFIRHWFCPLCAQYMNSILAEVSPEALERADVDLIIIGNGSGKMLPAYKNKAFKCPFKMFTDPSLMLYRALGLTRQTGDAGPESEKGDYLIQTPLEATMQTLKRATLMPLRNPGHFTQLGGEFIFSGPLNLDYTHRMSTTRDHAPIRDLCEIAGVRLEFIHYEPGPSPPPVHRRSWIGEDGNDEAQRGNQWKEERDEEVERIKQLKAQRRAGRFGAEHVRIIGEEDTEEREELESRFSTLVV